MKLSNEDAKLFYELFFPLLDYVNREYHILPEEDYFGQGMIDPQDAAEVAHFLWERTWIIDDYLERSDLPEEHMEILKSWKGCITGRFIIERHLKKGSVFISIDDNSVFLVNGIVSSWEEMLRNAPMPTLLDAALLPIKMRSFPMALYLLCRSYSVRTAKLISKKYTWMQREMEKSKPEYDVTAGCYLPGCLLL